MEAYWFWMSHAFYLDRGWARALIASFGSPQEVFLASEEDVKERFPKLGKRRSEVFRMRESWDVHGAYEACMEQGIRFVSCEHEAFPKRLREVPDAPLGLYGKGSFPDSEKESIAVVGARSCTDYGRMVAERFGKGLAECGVPVISGMAYGIDGYAHMGALEAHGSTYAVLGCGVDICYPKHNRYLYEMIQKQGGILSEYPPGTPPLAHLFPQRNRIISGLSRAVIVVEAKEKSGSLITVDMALEQGREVFAVPGRIGDSLSEGCNRLLSQGAGIAISPDFVCKELGIFDKNKVRQDGIKKKSLESHENIVYSCLSLQSQHIDEIQKKAGFSLIETMRILVSLELKGVACETQKNYYSKKEVG